MANEAQDQLQLDLTRVDLHSATQDALAHIETTDPIDLRGYGSRLGRELLAENHVPISEFDIASNALHARLASGKASPELIAAQVEPDIAPDPRPRPLSRRRPVAIDTDSERPRDFRERQFKD